MEQQVRDNVFLDRMIGSMSSAFAGLATLLAAIGLYGVLAYTVAQRTREIGVRMALGATGLKVRSMVLRQVATLTAIGGIAGCSRPLAWGTQRILALRHLGDRPAGLHRLVTGAHAVSLAAGFIPAVRASRVNPMEALRYE